MIELSSEPTGAYRWHAIGGHRVRFFGSVRVLDRGANVFAVFVDGTGEVFGEFRPKFSQDDTTFSIEVSSFGYRVADHVGDTHAEGRIAFPEGDLDGYRSAIKGLFEVQEPRPYPLRDLKHFDHTVTFAQGWARTA